MSLKDSFLPLKYFALPMEVVASEKKKTFKEMS